MTETRDEATFLVLTIGHSTRAAGEFVEMLRAHGVARLVDVRRTPRSRRNPQFNEDALREELGSSGIGYARMPGLGGRRRPRPDSPNAGWRNPSFRGYADHMRTQEFLEGLETLVETCERERVCLMCSEAVWWRCHRRMIADALVVRGIPVGHVLGEGRRQAHTLTPWTRVDGEDGRLVYPPDEPSTTGSEGAGSAPADPRA